MIANTDAVFNNPELMQFIHVEDNVNGRQTTHHRREILKDGSEIIYRRHITEVADLIQSFPTSADGAKKTIKLTGSGKTKKSADGSVVATHETGQTNIGSGPVPNVDLIQQGKAISNDAEDIAAFSCIPGTSPDGNKKCEDVPNNVQSKANIERLEIGFDITTTRLSAVASTLVQTMDLEQYAQHLATQGYKLVDGQAVMRKRQQQRRQLPIEPDNAAEDSAELVRLLERSSDDELAEPKMRATVEQMLRSSRMRRLMLNKLRENSIKKVRAVQLLLYAMGRVGMEQPASMMQLISLANDKGVKIVARQQALLALLHARCWEHDPVIQALGDLAKPQTSIGWMALHVQHGLVGHAQHCALGHYGEAAHYSDLLQQARDGLTQAVANHDDRATEKWLYVLGNSYSQAKQHTALIAKVAHNRHLSLNTRRAAIRNLGRLYTADAVTHLEQLASGACQPDQICNPKAISDAAASALSGQHLHKGDPRWLVAKSRAHRDLLTQSVATTGGDNKVTRRRRHVSSIDEEEGESGGTNSKKNNNIKYEKSLNLPSGGDFRAIPKVGVKIELEPSLCLKVYAGVDIKLWAFTVNLIETGLAKCASEDATPYVEILGVQVFPEVDFGGAEFGLDFAGGPETGLNFAGGDAFGRSLDQQGYCTMDIDMADLVATISSDVTFLEYWKGFIVGPILVTGKIELSGEIGLKFGAAWEAFNSDNVQSTDPRCKSGTMGFIVPFAVGKLSAELAVDGGSIRGGVGVEVMLVKFQLPATSESLLNLETGAAGGTSCAGLYFKTESLGGRIYGFVDVAGPCTSKDCWAKTQGWKFWKAREWHRLLDITLWNWASPFVWVSNELKCNPDPSRIGELKRLCSWRKEPLSEGVFYANEGNERKTMEVDKAKDRCFELGDCQAVSCKPRLQWIGQQGWENCQTRKKEWNMVRNFNECYEGDAKTKQCDCYQDVHEPRKGEDTKCAQAWGRPIPVFNCCRAELMVGRFSHQLS